jgi:virginiamycin A acetyltransferase
VDWPADLIAEQTRTIRAGTPADIAHIATEHGQGKSL